MDIVNAWTTLIAFVVYMDSSLQTETEQNSKAILEQLREESDHSESMVMALDGTCVSRCGADEM